MQPPLPRAVSSDTPHRFACGVASSRRAMPLEVHMRNGLALSSTLALALALATPAMAQQTRPMPAQPAMTQPDMNFMKEAAAGGLAEVELGKLAQQNGQSDQVKQFGARMVTDHGNANQQLTSLASGKGMTLP